MTAGCTGTIRAVDVGGIDRGLGDPRMARMEATRLLGSCLCYTSMQLVSIFAVQPALANCMGAHALADVVSHGGSFDSKALAMTPGLLAGAGVEGLDGFFGTLIATLAALQSGNEAVAERGRGMLKVVKENMGTLQTVKETAERSIQHASVRMFVNNLFADLNVLMSLSLDDQPVVEAIVREGTHDKGGVAIGLTEFRGKLVGLYRDLPKKPADVKAPERSGAVHFDPDLGFGRAPLADAFDAPEGKENKESKGPRRGGLYNAVERQVRAIEANLVPGATFMLHSVPCKVRSVTQRQGGNRIEIVSERPLGGGWIGSDTENSQGGDWFVPGEYRYLYKGSLSVIAKALAAEDVLPGMIQVITDGMVLARGLERAGSVTVLGDDGKEAQVPVQRQDGMLRIGQAGDPFHEEGSPIEVAGKLLRRGLSFRNVALEDPDARFEVGRTPIHTEGDLLSVLRTIGRQFVLSVPGPGPLDARSVTCDVVAGGIRVREKQLPNSVSARSKGITFFPEDQTYRSPTKANLAAWLWSQGFEFRAITTASAQSDPSAVDRSSQPLSPSQLRTLPAVTVDRDVRKGDFMLIDGIHCRVDNLSKAKDPAQSSVVLRADWEVEVLKDLGECLWKKDEWQCALSLDDLNKVMPLPFGREGIVLGSEQLTVRGGKGGETILLGARDKPNSILVDLFGQQVAQVSEEGWTYVIPRNLMAAKMQDFREAVLSQGVKSIPARERVAQLLPGAREAGEDDITNARTSIEQLQVDFGTRRRRVRAAGPVAAVRGSPDARQHNQRILQACMRVLDGTSFLRGDVFPLGGIRALLDLSGFSGKLGPDDFAQVDRALVRGAGNKAMRLDGRLTRIDLEAVEQDRSQAIVDALAPHLAASLGDVVSAYARDWGMTASDMTDAVALLAAGSPAGSPAREAEVRFSAFAQTGGDPRALMQDLEALRDKAKGDDPLRTQALKHLERIFAELCGPAAK